MHAFRNLTNRARKLIGQPHVDRTETSLAHVLAPYDAPPDPLGSIFERLRARDGCPHWHSTSTDDLPLGNPRKVFHCPDCGLDYREVVSVKEPWKVIDYREVMS